MSDGSAIEWLDWPGRKPATWKWDPIRGRTYVGSEIRRLPKLEKPMVVFVDSKIDLFHESVPDDALDYIFTVMSASHQQVFIILTEHTARMRAFVSDANRIVRAWRRCFDGYVPGWPLRNVILGTSVEDQPTADERVPDLQATPAACRTIIYEPALGPLDLSAWLPSIGWVIAGGESGQDDRPAHPNWFRSVRDQCISAGVPFFFKQWGEMISAQCADNGQAHRPIFWKNPSTGKTMTFFKIGKRRAGRLLDGVEHNGLPEMER